MTALIRGLMAVVVAMLGLAVAAPIATAVAAPTGAASYAYDTPHLNDEVAYDHVGRGPPTYPHAELLDSDVDRGSDDSLARPSTTSYTYDADAPPAKHASSHGTGIPRALEATATTTGSGEVDDGRFASLPASPVAAKAAPEFPEVSSQGFPCGSCW